MNTAAAITDMMDTAFHQFGGKGDAGAYIIRPPRKNMGLRMSEEEYASFKAGRTPKTEKPTKYRSREKIAAGITFQSTKEANRYIDLAAQQQAGQITELTHQRIFEINIGEHHICEYQSDFTYKRDGAETVEDTKSKVTRKLAVYRLKKKLMLAVLGVDIQEI